jgi:hypothetical protein
MGNGLAQGREMRITAQVVHRHHQSDSGIFPLGLGRSALQASRDRPAVTASLIRSPAKSRS